MFWIECITCRGLCRACPKYVAKKPCNADCTHYISMINSSNKLTKNKGKINGDKNGEL